MVNTSSGPVRGPVGPAVATGVHLLGQRRRHRRGRRGRGGCDFQVKAANAQAAGYDAVIIFNEGNPGRTDLFIGTLGARSTSRSSA
jgi:PA domain